MQQLTREEAIDFNEWKTWDHRQRAMFQMAQDKLCMPFDKFHEAIEKTLGRPVFTHEFGLNPKGLMKELLGQKDAPTMEDIMNLIPEHMRVVVVSDRE